MKAKDTIMDDLAQAIIAHPDLPMGRAIAIEQAEISFKAGEQESDKKWRQILRDSVAMAKLEGKREGMKEEVEWRQENCPHKTVRFNE